MRKSRRPSALAQSISQSLAEQEAEASAPAEPKKREKKAPAITGVAAYSSSENVAKIWKSWAADLKKAELTPEELRQLKKLVGAFASGADL